MQNKNENSPDVLSYYKEQVRNESKGDEAEVIAGILQDLSKLDDYPISESIFLNEGWKTYFTIARDLHKEGLTLTEQNIELYLGNGTEYTRRPDTAELYEKHGGWKTIEKILATVKISHEEFECYYNRLVKYSSLFNHIQSMRFPNPRELVNKETEEMYAELLNALDDSFSEANRGMIEHSVSDGLSDLIETLDEGEQRGLDIGLHMERLNDIIKGFLPGRIYGLGALSGTGKSTVAINMLTEIALSTNEKVVIIVNEEDYRKVQQEMLLYVMNNKIRLFPFKKDRFFEGNFSTPEKGMLKQASEFLTVVKDKL